MALNNNDQIRVRDYLLGHLSDDEQEQMEERFMSDDELFEELEILKDELTEEYRAGELPQNDRQWFRSHYLASPEGKLTYTFAMALDCVEKPAVVVPTSPTFFEQLSSLFRIHRWKIATVGISALMVVFVAGLFLRSQPQNSLAFTLNSTASRRNASDTKIERVVINSNVSELRVSLTLPEPTSQPGNYRAELDDRRQIKNVTVAERDTNSVLVVIPANQLPAGFYALRLYASTPFGKEHRVPGDFYFMVERN